MQCFCFYFELYLQNLARYDKIDSMKKQEEIHMKAVITVIGKDRVGIISMVSGECAKSNVNVIDINQTVLDGYFTMIMVVEIGEMTEKFSDFSDRLAEKGKENALDIRVMHEDIFNAMHKI